MEPTIRHGERTLHDATGVYLIYREFKEYLESFGDTSNYFFTVDTYFEHGFGDDVLFEILVAENDLGEIVGFLMYNKFYSPFSASNLMWVSLLCVARRLQRQGVGRKLIVNALQICRERGWDRLILSVYARNTDAQAFYAALGFERIEDEVDLIKYP